MVVGKKWIERFASLSPMEFRKKIQSLRFIKINQWKHYLPSSSKI